VDFLIEFTALASPVTWQKELYELNDAMEKSGRQQSTERDEFSLPFFIIFF
jgi:hypothetical protein